MVILQFKIHPFWTYFADIQFLYFYWLIKYYFVSIIIVS